jgi:hypothetical protein
MHNLHERIGQWQHGRTLTQRAYTRSLRAQPADTSVETHDRQPYVHVVRLHPTGPRLVRVNPQERCQ